MQKGFEFRFISGLLYLPNCLGKCISSSPKGYPKGPIVIFVSQFYNEITSIKNNIRTRKARVKRIRRIFDFIDMLFKYVEFILMASFSLHAF